MMSNNQQQPAATRRTVEAYVTKLVGEGGIYGVIDDHIFFQQTCVVGSEPAAVDDRVLAECEYSPNLPFKWNATSVKIINKGARQGQPQPSDFIPAADPRRQPRQNLNQPPPPLQQQQQQQQPPPPLPQQQQQQQQPPPPQPFNQSPNPNVAVTYQQHRQQRQQQRQAPDSTQQPDVNMVNPHHHQQQQQQHQLHQQLDQPPVPRLLDQVGNPGGEPFYTINQPPPPFVSQPQPPSEIQPFHEPPMGPPKLTYTSQLGSAFVQTPMVSPSFMPQQPPMLPQTQQLQHQQQQQQQHSPLMNNQNNQRNQLRGSSTGGGAGGGIGGNNRFNSQGDKNNRQDNRQDNRRNLNRTSGDRDHYNNSSSNNNSNNNRSRQNESRDRSANRSNSRREDVRPSPPARSTTSISSDRTKGRKHYDAQNIPKSLILTDLNSSNMRQRCSSSVHVPSDLKNVIVNRHLRVDIKNTPKPICYKIESATEGAAQKENSTTQKVETEKGPEMVAKQENENNVQDKQEPPKKPEEPPTKPTQPAKSDVRLNHKYGVKVVLFSLPELESIYKKVFGTNLDSYSSDSRPQSKLDETITLLCNKGSTGGHSLIGGKFDPTLDGFIEGANNDLERHGRQPDLIATCRRVVLEQTGLDLSSCKSWTLVSTFMYNHKSDYFSSKASIEYSYIYMPQVWTMTNEKFDESMMMTQEKEEIKPDNGAIVNNDATGATSNDVVEATSEVTASSEAPITPDTAVIKEEEPMVTETADGDVPLAPAVDAVEPGIRPLSELKVVDLKNELDKREIKYKPNAKKAELVALLQEHIDSAGTTNVIPPEGATSEPPKAEAVEEEEETKVVKEEPQLEEGEVVTEENSPEQAENVPTTETQPIAEAAAAVAATPEESSGGKRKASEVVTSEEDTQTNNNNKKQCIEETTTKKEEKVELVKEPFLVRARDGQQQLTLVTLHDAYLVSKYDQFELSVVSTILREALIQHLSEYILTVLVEDTQKELSQEQEHNSGSSIASSQETTNSDTNNNNNNTSKQQVLPKTKEYPVDRYVNLAFSYFDTSHTGFVQADDLIKLFNNTGLSVSKRALISLIGDTEKFNYRTLPDLPLALSSLVYKFPEQFKRLPQSSSSSSKASSSGPAPARMVEVNGVCYDVEKLVQQVEDANTLRVNLVDRFNQAIINHDKQVEEIHVLEVSQKTLTKAIQTQNNEICELKRERDSMRKKLSELKKSIKTSISTLTDLVNDDK